MGQRLLHPVPGILAYPFSSYLTYRQNCKNFTTYLIVHIARTSMLTRGFGSYLEMEIGQGTLKIWRKVTIRGSHLRFLICDLRFGGKRPGMTRIWNAEETANGRQLERMRSRRASFGGARNAPRWSWLSLKAPLARENRYRPCRSTPMAHAMLQLL